MQKTAAIDEAKLQANKPPASKKKLSYKFQHELELLPAKIEQLEQEVERKTAQMAEPNFYQQDPSIIAEQGNELKAIQDQLQQAYERWEQLESEQ